MDKNMSPLLGGVFMVKNTPEVEEEVFSWSKTARRWRRRWEEVFSCVFVANIMKTPPPGGGVSWQKSSWEEEEFSHTHMDDKNMTLFLSSVLTVK